MDRYNPIEAVSWGARFPLGMLRVVAALLILEHGTQALLGYPAGAMYARPTGLYWWMAVLELVGGGMLVIGLFCRPVGILLAGAMACAYFLVLAPVSKFPIINGGDSTILFCFVFFYIGVVGGGAFSIDSAVARR